MKRKLLVKDKEPLQLSIVLPGSAGCLAPLATPRRQTVALSVVAPRLKQVRQRAAEEARELERQRAQHDQARAQRAQAKAQSAERRAERNERRAQRAAGIARFLSD